MINSISIRLTSADVEPEHYHIFLDGELYGSAFDNLSDVFKEVVFLANGQIDANRIRVVRHDVVEHVFNINFGEDDDNK